MRNLTDTDFAVNIVLVVESMDGLVAAIKALGRSVAKVSLKINWNQTKIPPDRYFEHTEGTSPFVGDHPVKVVGDITYLHSTVNNMGGTEKKLEAHTARVSSVMVCLIRIVFCKPNTLIRTEMKLRIYNVLMVSILTDGTEKRPLTVKTEKKLDTDEASNGMDSSRRKRSIF